MSILEIIALVLIVVGVVFFLGSVIGVLRFPDFYTRMHAAGKGDTLSSLLIALGLALYNLHDLSAHNVLTGAKILLICVFIFITGPTTTHVLMDAGHALGIKPWRRDDQLNDEEVSP